MMKADAPNKSGPSGNRAPAEQFQRMQATALYCPKCREATPVKETLLLVLPNGSLYDYRCARCGTSTGSRTEKLSKDIQIITK